MSPIPAFLPILPHHNEDEKGGVIGGGVVLEEEEEYDDKFSFGFFFPFFLALKSGRWGLFNIERRAINQATHSTTQCASSFDQRCEKLGSSLSSIFGPVRK